MSAALNSIYVVRDVKSEDKNFILASFLNGVYYGNSLFNLIPKAIFMENYKEIANELYNNQLKTVVKVACLKDDEDIILGYSILSADYLTIHFVYVKEKFRHQGIGKSLVPLYPTSVTHLTKLGIELLKRFPNTIYNPFF